MCFKHKSSNIEKSKQPYWYYCPMLALEPMNAEPPLEWKYTITKCGLFKCTVFLLFLCLKINKASSTQRWHAADQNYWTHSQKPPRRKNWKRIKIFTCFDFELVGHLRLATTIVRLWCQPGKALLDVEWHHLMPRIQTCSYQRCAGFG